MSLPIKVVYCLHDFISNMVAPISWFFKRNSYELHHIPLQEVMMTMSVEESLIPRLIPLKRVWWRPWISFVPELKQVFPLNETDNECKDTLKSQWLSIFQPHQITKKVFKWQASIFIRYLCVKLFYLVNLLQPKHLRNVLEWHVSVHFIVMWGEQLSAHLQDIGNGNGRIRFSGARQEAEKLQGGLTQWAPL